MAKAPRLQILDEGSTTPLRSPQPLVSCCQAGPAVRRALWVIGERRFPHLRYDFHPDQQVLGTPQPASWPSCMNAGPGRPTSDVP
jgi:hypothetical protein